jgi:hypothetical protein
LAKLERHQVRQPVLPSSASFWEVLGVFLLPGSGRAEARRGGGKEEG